MNTETVGGTKKATRPVAKRGMYMDFAGRGRKPGPAVATGAQRTAQTVQVSRTQVAGAAVLQPDARAAQANARIAQQRAQAESEGMNAILLAQLGQIIPDMQMILNTIPAWVLDETMLEKVPEGCWLLETASAPYGFDRQAAGKMGKQCALLPGLPARYAPASAALVLYRAVQQLTGRCS